jgi:hypothetical protein
MKDLQGSNMSTFVSMMIGHVAIFACGVWLGSSDWKK